MEGEKEGAFHGPDCGTDPGQHPQTADLAGPAPDLREYPAAALQHGGRLHYRTIFGRRRLRGRGGGGHGDEPVHFHPQRLLYRHCGALCPVLRQPGPGLLPAGGVSFPGVRPAADGGSGTGGPGPTGAPAGADPDPGGAAAPGDGISECDLSRFAGDLSL